MYEMRAGPSTTGSSGQVWHVMAKHDARATLCGRKLASHGHRPSDQDDDPTARYCSPCMTAFREILDINSAPAHEHRPA
ncbi:hypothetical protein [Streptomyces sp. bgisy084]|uniref:hypothetical protein n=1 Tax=unclassified Streptomyces TaxID=2593676 RepID=UPI003D74741A